MFGGFTKPDLSVAGVYFTLALCTPETALTSVKFHHDDDDVAAATSDKNEASREDIRSGDDMAASWRLASAANIALIADVLIIIMAARHSIVLIFGQQAPDGGRFCVHGVSMFSSES